MTFMLKCMCDSIASITTKLPRAMNVSTHHLRYMIIMRDKESLIGRKLSHSLCIPYSTSLSQEPMNGQRRLWMTTRRTSVSMSTQRNNSKHPRPTMTSGMLLRWVWHAFIQDGMHTHTRAHTHTHTHTHTHIRACTHALTHTGACTHAHVQWNLEHFSFR